MGLGRVFGRACIGWAVIGWGNVGDVLLIVQSGHFTLKLLQAAREMGTPVLLLYFFPRIRLQL